MTTDEHVNGDNRYRDALARIAAIAASVTTENGETAEADTDIGCRIKVLPPRLRERAAANARKINPVNAPLQAPLGRTAPLDPQRLTLDTARYWGPAPRQFTVSFVESTPADLRARILEHMNAWNATCGMSFVLTNGTGEVRISRGPGGFWSYLGTDILLIPTNRPTMNLQGFTMNTRESEYHRVVRHETGHTLGFPHEHMRRELVARIDPQRAYPYFLADPGLGPGDGRRPGADGARRRLDLRHSRRPGLDHVLPAARPDHGRRAADPRRPRHQRDGRGLRRPRLPARGGPGTGSHR